LPDADALDELYEAGCELLSFKIQIVFVFVCWFLLI